MLVLFRQIISLKNGIMRKIKNIGKISINITVKYLEMKNSITESMYIKGRE
jgi:hypothetical protein